jgi:hypothetical protein
MNGFVPKILDAHGHFGFFNTFHIPHASVEEMVRNMDEVGVSQICISAFAALQADCRWGNKLVYEAVCQEPDRFLGYATINPYGSAQQMIEELDRCFGEYNFAAIKLHPDLNGKQVEDEAYLPVYEYANEHRLTILIHYGTLSKYVENIVNRFPDLYIILAHFGGVWDGYTNEPMFDLVNEYPQIYTDTASSVYHFRSIEKLVEKVDPKKIIFGSDMPFLNLAGQVGRITKAKLPPQIKQDILGENFRSLLSKRKVG